jgi:hypothetical protein
MDRHWSALGRPTMADAATRHQLIALPWCPPDRPELQALAAEVRHVWLRLTRACHGGSYDLPPGRDQLLAWADVLERFDEVAHRAEAPS